MFKLKDVFSRDKLKSFFTKSNIKNAAKAVYTFLKIILQKFTDILGTNGKCFFVILISSFLLNILEESSLRKSLPAAIKLIWTSPLAFAYNTLLILAVYSLIYLFRKRFFTYTLITVLWLIIGFVSKNLMTYRTTPFNASDFRVVREAINMIPIYLDAWEIVAIVIAVIAVIALLILALIKSGKTKEKFKASAVYTVIICLMTLSATLYNLNYNLDTTHFSNLPNAYKKYGFNFCFLCSVLDQGIQKPKDYSKQVMETIASDLDTKVDEEQKEPEPEATPMRPNILFLQLESFYDVNKISGYTFSEQPIPVFSSLKANYPTGKLKVPSIGAGTANTEFEVLTGMEVSFFGVAEYPYLSVLQNHTCESIAYNTKAYGYTSHVIHNYKGTFYDRNKVFPNLGFDTFTTLEAMPDIQKNKRGWARDSMLTSNIMEALASTPDSSDLVYTISVQPHGRYPESWASYEKMLDPDETHITVSGNDDFPDNAGFTYYINELHECDAFVGTLISELSNLGEPTILVMYGDHLPAFNVDNWVLSDGNYYQTDYVIWNNCGIDYSDATDLTSYQLSSYIFSKLGITDGYMNRLNQSYLGTDTDYSERRQLLEYDMLYGDASTIEGKYSYAPTTPTFGQAKIEIDSISTYNGVTYLKGNNFNMFSKVTVNDDICDTTFIDGNTVTVNYVPHFGDTIAIVQTSGNRIILGQSVNSMVYDESMLHDENEQVPYDIIPPKYEGSQVSENDKDAEDGIIDREPKDESGLYFDEQLAGQKSQG